MENPDDPIGTLLRLIVEARHCVAFTGAGVSTLSGIPDFRGKNGLYKSIDAERMFDINIFRRDPSLYYRLAKDFIYGLAKREASIVHKTLAKLEKSGLLAALITQNIDMLHKKAGSSTVIEIHGSPELHRCRRCGFEKSFAEVLPQVQADKVPLCPNCGIAIKPDIVFFGENLPSTAMAEAVSHARSADLMLVLGSSLTVYPAASLPTLTLSSGGKIVIINDQETHLDRQAALRLNDLETSFTELWRRLEAREAN